MDIKQLLLFALPSIALAVVVVIWFAERSLRSAREVQRFEIDRFRQDLERQIASLSRQLTTSEERFKSVNHLVLDAQNVTRDASSSEIVPSEFLRDLGVDSLKIDRKLVFVLMPFNSEFNPVFDVIKSVCEELGFRCSRGDDEFVSSNILAHILREVARARVIIAEITGRNPNVFYELGIAHAIGKPVLLLAQTPENIPFDIGAIRVLIYRNAKDLGERLRRWLVHAIAD